MNPDTFEFLANLIKQRSGIALTPDKDYLLEARLLPLARKRNMDTLEGLVTHMRGLRDETMMNEITEAMTTNESLFFRDQKPFDHFRQILLPRFLAANASTKRIRIWSAASSSGQEAYSLAMVCAEEAVRLKGWKIDIVGTDLSNQMVRRAAKGVYSQFEAQRGLPIAYLMKYFKQVEGGWQINEEIREMVKFQQGNLLHDNNVLGTFDIVFCRNVLIYFDVPTKTKVLDSISRMVVNEGVLIVGGSEILQNITDKFKPMDAIPGIFVPNKAATAPVTEQKTG